MEGKYIQQFKKGSLEMILLSLIARKETYGYEIISENEMSRLVNLWELREESRHVSGPYSDRVIEMPELASHAMWNAYRETISEYNAKIAAMQKEARRIAEENFRRAANRETT